MTTHRHKPTRTSEALPFNGPVKARAPEPRAHGGCRYEAYCRCGAVRVTNHNGQFMERGQWSESVGTYRVTASAAECHAQDSAEVLGEAQ